MTAPPLEESTPMATERACYTAEDVLDLLHDVESNIRKDDRHFAASVKFREVRHGTALVLPTGEIVHPRIRLPPHSSHAPMPPIIDSEEDWSPRRSDAGATSTGDPGRLRVRLPQYAPRDQTLPATNSGEQWSPLTSTTSRIKVQSQRIGAHSSLLRKDESTFDSFEGKVVAAGDETKDFDLPEVRPDEVLSTLATCGQIDPPITAHIFHGEDMEIDREPCFTLARRETVVTPNSARNKRRRASDLWHHDEDERQRHASKRVKLVLKASTLTTSPQPGVVSNSFSESPHQS